MQFLKYIICLLYELKQREGNHDNERLSIHEF